MRILFLCSHGSAKSVIAATHFNQRAAELGLPFTAAAAAAEDPYDSVPAPVADRLESEGIDVRGFKPRQAGREEMEAAARVIAIGCDVAVSAERWDDVPQASDDLEGAVAAIRRHVDALAEELRGRR